MELKLQRCDIGKCEAMCCHDGVYLEPAEEAALRAIVEREPALRARLPGEYIVEGHWNGEHLGRKTATRPHDYRNPEYPSHFPRTRCVFADEAGYCELEKLARSRDEHPWKYKPFTCWMFPLEATGRRTVPPPARAAEDPYRSQGYDGFVSRVPCGRHDPDGEPWRSVLEKELHYFHASRPRK